LLPPCFEQRRDHAPDRSGQNCRKEHQDQRAAEKQAATKASVEEKLQKTGNSPYFFQSLHVQLEDGVFLPGTWLNDIRRRALEALEETLVDIPTRAALPYAPIGEQRDESNITGDFATIQNIAHLPLLLKSASISYIGFDTSITFGSKDKALSCQIKFTDSYVFLRKIAGIRNTACFP